MLSAILWSTYLQYREVEGGRGHRQGFFIILSSSAGDCNLPGTVCFSEARGADLLCRVRPLSVTKPFLPLLFAKKFTFLRNFRTRRWRPELRSGPFGLTLVSICRSVTELAAETRVGSNGQESSSERQFRIWWANAHVKIKASKKVPFLVPAPADRTSAKQEKSRNFNNFDIG